MIKNALSKNSGVTILVLVITIIVIIILSTVTINAILGDNGLLRQSQATRDQTENSITSEETETNEILIEYANVLEEDKDISVGFQPVQTPEPEETTNTEFTMSYGVIEIKWLSGTSNYVTGTPNAPKLKNISNGTMELVKYDESRQDWVVGTEYSYVKQSGNTENGGTSKWANARVTIDNVDSYFVWIPRYAYRIIYFDSETSEEAYRAGTLTEADGISSGKIVGYSDSRGIVDKDGRKVSTVASTTKIMVSEDYFMPHPAFTSNVNVGGFGQELEGIWIGKYEASLANKSDGSNVSTTNTDIGNILLSNNTDKTLAVQPNVRSWRSINIGNAYTNARSYSEELESHMLKNSEWGAMAYLTESCYGRNGTEVTINNNSNFITGNAGDSVNAGNASETTNAYNTSKGILASSTGNVYGIYDISGCGWELTANYYNGEDAENITNGSSFASINGESTPYATVYNSSGSDSISASQNYIYGDGTYETRAWDSDISNFTDSSVPFFVRSGYSYSGTRAGVFSCSGNTGSGLRYHWFLYPEVTLHSVSPFVYYNVNKI